MARLPRYSITNQCQHVILLARDGQTLYFEEQDYQYFHDCLDAAAYNYNLKVHAWALLPERVHLLATPGNADSVSRVVQSLGRNYVQYFNETYGAEGTLWEGRYRATVIDAKHYLLDCSRFIESAPVRDGLVNKPGDYAWSSFARNAQGKADEMITPAREYRALGDNDKECAGAYRKLFRSKLDNDLATRIHDSAMKGWVLGDARFAAKIEKLSGRRAAPLPKGRPRKQ